MLADVPDTSTTVTDETFGPTVTLHRVANLDDAVGHGSTPDATGWAPQSSPVAAVRRSPAGCGAEWSRSTASSPMPQYRRCPSVGSAIRDSGGSTVPTVCASSPVPSGHPAPIPSSGAGAHLRAASLGVRFLLRIVRVLYGR